MEPFVYRANHYKKVLAFDYDFKKVEAHAKAMFEGKDADIADIVSDILQYGQFDNPVHKKSYDKMIQDGYIRFDIGKGHGILFFFHVVDSSEAKQVHVNCIVAS